VAASASVNHRRSGTSRSSPAAVRPAIITSRSNAAFVPNVKYIVCSATPATLATAAIVVP
jgi:hypothetical protein